MLAGGAELGLVHGRLKSRWWRLTWPLAFAVTGLAFIIHEQNPWFFARSAFLHHLLGWTFVVGAIAPAPARVASALGGAAGVHGADDRRRRGHALRRPRRRAGVRSPLAARRAAAPMRRIVLAALVALAFPAAASAHATLRSTTPPFGHELQRSPQRIVLRFDQEVKVLPGSIKVLNGVGAQYAMSARPRRESRRRPRRAAEAGRVHRALARDLGGLARRLGRVDVRRARAGARGRRGLRRRRPDGRGALRALGVVPRDRARDRLARLPAHLPARTASAARARAASRRRGGDRRLPDAAGGHRRVLAPRRGCAAAAVRGLLLRRPLADGGDALRPRVRRDDARLRARARAALPVVAARPHRAARARVRALAALRRRAVVVRARRARSRLVVEDGDRRLGAHRRRVDLDRRARDDGRPGLVRRARTETAGVHELLAACHRPDRARARRRHVPQHRAAAARERLVDAGVRSRAAREDRARRASRSPGVRSTTSSCGPRSTGADAGFLSRIGRSLVGESLVGLAVLLVAAVLVDSKPPIRASDQQSLQGGAATKLQR